jgi:hypothetical protein
MRENSTKPNWGPKSYCPHYAEELRRSLLPNCALVVLALALLVPAYLVALAYSATLWRRDVRRVLKGVTQ